jgi:hypothetical protein
MIRRTIVALALVGLGWAAAMAQAPATPDFEFTIITKAGETTVECVRGCGLQWIEWVRPDRSEAKRSVTYGCQGRSPCPSGRLGGWITR